VSFSVLVVDDDPDTQSNFRDILELDGYLVEDAGSAAEALAHDNWTQIGAILLDRRLPDGTAEDLLPRLRDLAPDAAIIVVTGYADVYGAIAAFRLGAVDFALKPIDPDELRSRLRRIAEHRRDREDLRQREDELRAMTQQLWQAAKLASVGELAASIAHELNNPLSIVSLRLETVLAKTPADDPRRRLLEVADQEVGRMAELVANLLNFSRTGREQVSIVDLCEEVAKTIELVDHHLFRKKVRIEREFSRGVPLINADRQQLRQVLLNLLTNAGDAMPDGGQLAVRIRSGEMAGKTAAVFEVTDTGTGIPPEHLPRIFDPFFTTKEEGKGTGLGLAICKRIVDQHQGILEVESKVGSGTTVRVTLPARTAADPGDTWHG
jgi:signal transduction histidine kinase